MASCSIGGLRLALGAHEEHRAALGHRVAHHLRGGVERLHGLLQVDDVDAAALGKDVRAHLGIPAAGAVPKVDARLQKLLHRNVCHVIS